MKDKWLTYEREWNGNTVKVTCLNTERRPTGFGLPPRPATKAEILAETTKRKKQDEDRRARAAFEERQDYKDAREIRDIIEFQVLNLDSDCIDRLTPADLAELRRRLTA